MGSAIPVSRHPLRFALASFWIYHTLYIGEEAEMQMATPPRQTSIDDGPGYDDGRYVPERRGNPLIKTPKGGRLLSASQAVVQRPTANRVRCADDDRSQDGKDAAAMRPRDPPRRHGIPRRDRRRALALAEEPARASRGPAADPRQGGSRASRTNRAIRPRSRRPGPRSATPSIRSGLRRVQGASPGTAHAGEGHRPAQRLVRGRDPARRRAAAIAAQEGEQGDPVNTSR